MNTILVVMYASGSYDSYQAYPVLVTPEQTVAQNFVDDMKARPAKANANRDILHRAMSTWHGLNPRPQHEHKRGRVDPKYQSLFGEWVKAFHAAKQAEEAKFTQTEKEDMDNIPYDSDWNIEEVPFKE